MADLIIGGLQKTTMIDFPGKVACTIFTKACNLKCPYCHNSPLVLQGDKEEELLQEDIFKFLKKRQDILDGVCISGGEPLIHKGILEFVRKIKEMGFQVKLDTNGFYPEKLKFLIEEALVDYVAMDIKSSLENYEKAAGVNGLDLRKIHKSIEILKTNKTSFEFRTTAVKGIHTRRDFESIASLIKGPHLYYIQNYQDSGDTIARRIKLNKSLGSFTKDQLEAFLQVIKVQLANAQIRYE